MGAKTTTYASDILDYVFSLASFTPPGTIYIGLTVSGVEVSGSNYARVGVTNNATEWPAASGTPRTKSNANIIQFNTPSGSWGVVDGVFIADASTSGNTFYTGSTGPATVNTGADVHYAPGALQIQES